MYNVEMALHTRGAVQVCSRERPDLGAELVQDGDRSRVDAGHVELELEALGSAVGGHARRDYARAISWKLVRAVNVNKHS